MRSMVLYGERQMAILTVLILYLAEIAARNIPFSALFAGAFRQNRVNFNSHTIASYLPTAT